MQALNKIVIKQINDQKAFSESSYSYNHLNQAVSLFVNKSVQISVTINGILQIFAP